MTDHMETSDTTSPRSLSTLYTPWKGSDTTLGTSSCEQDVTMEDIVHLNKELCSTKQELERARNDCHRLNSALTSMVEYFTKESGQHSNKAVGSSPANGNKSDNSQPLISFDDDNFSDYNNGQGKTSPKRDDTLLGSVCSDLVSICVTEPSASWSSCATGRSSPPSEANASSIRWGSQHVDDGGCAGDAALDTTISSVAQLENEIMELALDDAKDVEEGEIIEGEAKSKAQANATETGTAISIEAMPADFWKNYAESPHPRNFLQLGIRYEAEQAGADAYKTVLMQNLPSETTTGRVLAHVRGGDVVGCTVVPASGVQGYDAAFVHFKDSGSAAAYADFVTAHPIYIGGRQLVAERLTTPTYPLNPQLHAAVYRYGATRCLRITGLAMSSAQLYEALLHHFRTPLVLDGVHDIAPDHRCSWIVARFASVETAACAWWLLKYSPHAVATTTVTVEYLPDPCNMPLSHLLSKSADRRPRNTRDHYSPRIMYGSARRFEEKHEPDVLVLDY